MVVDGGPLGTGSSRGQRRERTSTGKGGRHEPTDMFSSPGRYGTSLPFFSCPTSIRPALSTTWSFMMPLLSLSGPEWGGPPEAPRHSTCNERRPEDLRGAPVNQKVEREEGAWEQNKGKEEKVVWKKDRRQRKRDRQAYGSAASGGRGASQNPPTGQTLAGQACGISPSRHCRDNSLHQAQSTRVASRLAWIQECAGRGG